MLRRFLVALLFLMSFTRMARADPVQFVYEDTEAKKGRALARYARVELDGKFLGYTDLYGRIDIRRPPGTYQCRITFQGQSFTLTLTLTGNSQLKEMRIR